jgi:hypothetical protein
VIEDEEATHNRIAKKLNDLDTLSFWVALGFIIFWTLLGIGFILAILNLF